MAAIPSTQHLQEDEVEEQLLAVSSLSGLNGLYSEIQALQAKLDFYSELAVLEARNKGVIKGLSGVLGPVEQVMEGRRKELGTLLGKSDDPEYLELTKAVEQLKHDKEGLDKAEAALTRRLAAASTHLSSLHAPQIAQIHRRSTSDLQNIIIRNKSDWLAFRETVLPQWRASVTTLQQKLSALEAAQRQGPTSSCAIM